MFVDTNVLVYATQRRSPNRDAAGIALERHAEVEARLCLSGQIVREYMAVVTRPQLFAKPVPMRVGDASYAKGDVQLARKCGKDGWQGPSSLGGPCSVARIHLFLLPILAGGGTRCESPR
jgi:predicted nucleic acid-binding protein